MSISSSNRLYTTGLHTVTVSGVVELSTSFITWLVKHAPSHCDSFRCGRVVHLIIKQTLYHWASHCDSSRCGRVHHVIIRLHTTGLHTVTVSGVVELSISSITWLVKHAPSHWDSLGCVHLIIKQTLYHWASHCDSYRCGIVVHLIIKQTLYHWTSHCDSYWYGRVVHLIIKLYTTGLHTVTVSGVVELSISSSNRLYTTGLHTVTVPGVVEFTMSSSDFIPLGFTL